MKNSYELPTTMPSFRNPAACAGQDPRLFDPHPLDETARRRAQAICATCPARTECTAWATTHTEGGVWGGTYYPWRNTPAKRAAA